MKLPLNPIKIPLKSHQHPQKNPTIFAAAPKLLLKRKSWRRPRMVNENSLGSSHWNGTDAVMPLTVGVWKKNLNICPKKNTRNDLKHVKSYQTNIKIGVNNFLSLRGAMYIYIYLYIDR